MKKQIFILMSFLFLMLACRKEAIIPKDNANLILNVKAYLKDSVSEKDFQNLDFNSINICNYDSGRKIISVAFYNKKKSENFIAVKIDKAGIIEIAKIIELNTSTNNLRVINNVKRVAVTGDISIQSLNRKIRINSSIEDGFVTALHDKTFNTVQSYSSAASPYLDLPDVVVVAYLPSGGSSWSSWINLVEITGGTNYGGNFYQYLEPNYGGSGNYESPPIVPIQIDFETGNEKPAIDIKKYLKCFESIPDNGATCSIMILSDIPVDSDPYAFFDWTNGSPGHAFIQLRKQNGSESMQQIIGFYPELGWKTIYTTGPISGMFDDNEHHEFNASLEMNLSPSNFRNSLAHIQYLANYIKYDIDEYNCTDFALEVFNYTRTDKLIIPMYNIPGGNTAFGTSTPQGLFNKLKAMKDQGSPEAPNISIPGFKGYEGGSNGPCN